MHIKLGYLLSIRGQFWKKNTCLSKGQTTYYLIHQTQAGLRLTPYTRQHMVIGSRAAPQWDFQGAYTHMILRTAS